MIAYHKLVRDRIPEIIAGTGKQATFHACANEAEYLSRLVAKLREEVDEFDRDRNAEELADILEVIKALCVQLGFDPSDVEALRVKKEGERGGFEKRLVLEEVQ